MTDYGESFESGVIKEPTEDRLDVHIMALSLKGWRTAGEKSIETDGENQFYVQTMIRKNWFDD